MSKKQNSILGAVRDLSELMELIRQLGAAQNQVMALSQQLHQLKDQWSKLVDAHAAVTQELEQARETVKLLQNAATK